MTQCHDLEGWDVGNCCEVCHGNGSELIAVQLVDGRRIYVCCQAVEEALRQLDVDHDATLALAEKSSI